VLALVIATLLQVSPAPLRPPPRSPSVAFGADALLECDQNDDDALRPSPLGRECSGTSRTTSELTLALDDEYRSLAAEDAEEAWDRAFDEEREPLEDGWRWAEE
jgi:hypothetical protein